MKKILLTGFSPFGNNKINPSIEAVKLVPNEIESCLIIKKEINTSFYSSIAEMKLFFEKEKPDIIISTGVAVDRKEICLERVAININDADIKDNAGNLPKDEVIYKDGDSAYFSTLCNKEILKSLLDNNFPTLISNTAGTFVCNHLMYGILHMIKCSNRLNVVGGFIHVPDQNILSSEKVKDALIIAIKTVIQHEEGNRII